MYRRLKSIPNIHILGGVDAGKVERLPILSFLIEVYEDGKRHFLHYNFVCSLLNDLYGIQSRGGCQCAGPYAQRLLSLSHGNAQKYENELIDKKEYLRPGFSRLSFPYFMRTHQVEYICRAIINIAQYGWRLLPLYKFIPKTGEFKHNSRVTSFKDRLWLSHIFKSKDQDSPNQGNKASKDEHQWMEESLAASKDIFKGARSAVRRNGAGSSKIDQTQMFSEPSMQWFLMPSEAHEMLRKEGDKSEGALPVVAGPLADDGPGLQMIYPKQYAVSTEVVLTEAESKSSAASGTKRKSVTIDEVAARGPLSGTEMPAAEKQRKRPRQDEGKGEPAAPTSSSPLPRKASRKYPLRKAGDVEEKSQLLSRAITATKTNLAKNAKATLFPRPPKKIMRSVGKAISQWDMIREGDRLCLGLSGGKDSLALLHVLHTVQKRSPKSFTLAAATVDPGTDAFNPKPLIGYLKSLNIPYHFLSENIFERASCEMEGNSICSYCSRMKRGTLYTCCRKNNYNVLVLAQHLDDLAESFMMSALHNGQIRTMKAHYTIGKGDIRVIRPFVYTREAQLKEFSYSAKLPVINENCPACFEAPKERHRIKKMLAQEESLLTGMYGNLKRALIPLMDEKIYDSFKTIQDEVDARGKVRIYESSKGGSSGKPVGGGSPAPATKVD